jgi:hypothetical protein
MQESCTSGETPFQVALPGQMCDRCKRCAVEDGSGAFARMSAGRDLGEVGRPSLSLPLPRLGTTDARARLGARVALQLAPTLGCALWQQRAPRERASARARREFGAASDAAQRDMRALRKWARL